jgi:NitT/TauT family transport system substrate-binding protein
MGIRELFRPGCIGLIFLTAIFAAEPTFAQTVIKFSFDSRIEGPTAPFLLGIDRGYYKAENVSVNFEPAADLLEPITRVASGAYDMGFADINTLIKYRDQNPTAPVTAVFMVFNKPAYAVVSRKSRGVTKPKDLEGKKLGAPSTDGAFAQWKLFAKVNEIDATKISIENIGFPVREPLLQNGQVDGIIGFSYTILPNLKSMNVPADDIVPMLMADYGLKLYGQAIIVNTKFAAEKPEAVRAFLQAYARSLKESLRNQVSAIESVLKRNDALNKEVEIERLRLVLRENVLTPEAKALGFGVVDFARLDQAIDQLALTYEFKNKPKAADVFDASFLPTSGTRKTH